MNVWYRYHIVAMLRCCWLCSLGVTYISGGDNQPSWIMVHSPESTKFCKGLVYILGVNLQNPGPLARDLQYCTSILSFQKFTVILVVTQGAKFFIPHPMSEEWHLMSQKSHYFSDTKSKIKRSRGVCCEFEIRSF